MCSPSGLYAQEKRRPFKRRVFFQNFNNVWIFYYQTKCYWKSSQGFYLDCWFYYSASALYIQVVSFDNYLWLLPAVSRVVLVGSLIQNLKKGVFYAKIIYNSETHIGSFSTYFVYSCFVDTDFLCCYSRISVWNM